MSLGGDYPFPTIPVPLRFAFAVITVGVVLVIDQSFSSLIDDGSHFLLLATAVMTSAWLGGVGPGLLAVVLGALFGSLDAKDEAGSAHLALFVVHGLLITLVVAELRHANHRAEREARDAQQARLVSEAANRIKDEFLATISHELRTPLNAVLGWVHLIRNGHLDAATRTRGLDSIERNVRQQAQMTADLLDASKALTGRLRIANGPCSLCEAVSEAAEGAKLAAAAKRIEVVTEVSDPALTVLGDAARLRQIAWHLLANSIKFTPSGGRVSLRVDAINDRARLTVTDNGPGIDEDFLPRIFDRFTQEDVSPTRIAGGLGVGLALIRELVEMHGGEIRAANAAEGKGAVFTVFLPAQPATPPPRSAARGLSGAALDGDLAGVRVLVFDKDPDGREVLERVLQRHGAAVQTAGSLADALDSLEDWHPDVLVREDGSPDSDSYSVVGKVAALDPERGNGGRIPALALTSYSRRNANAGILPADRIHDLRKPLEPDTLTALVARLSGREPASTLH